MKASIVRGLSPREQKNNILKLKDLKGLIKLIIFHKYDLIKNI